ncbi:MAG: HYR domain-containing protein [Flavobacteriales bacterium]|nr:HYR domain-containing protein [Flavobacteriales bacterium]
MKLSTFLFITLLSTLSLFSTAQIYDWHNYLSGPTNGANEVVVDENGYVYVLGTFIGNSISSEGNSAPVISAGNDLYLAKFAPDGSNVWVKTFGGTWYDSTRRLYADGNGRIYAAVVIQYTPTTFSDGTTYENTGNYQVICFDTDGNHLWHQFQASSYNVNNITGDDEYIYISGPNDIVKADPATGEVIGQISTTGSYVIYNVESLANGNLAVIHTQNTDPGSLGGLSLTIGNMGMAGGIEYGLTVLDSLFQGVYAVGLGGSYFEPSMDSDPQSNVYCTLNINIPTTLGDFTISPDGSSWANLIVKISENGEVLFVSQFNSIESVETNDVLFANDGLYLGGNYGSELTIGDFNFPTNSNGDIYIVKLDTLGNFISGDSFGLPGATDRLMGLAKDQIGNYYFSGLSYGGSFHVGCYVHTGPNDYSFVVKAHDGDPTFPQPTITYSGAVLSASPDYPEELITWYHNDQVMGNSQSVIPTESGDYYCVFSGPNGCTLTSNILSIIPDTTAPNMVCSETIVLEADPLTCSQTVTLSVEVSDESGTAVVQNSWNNTIGDTLTDEFELGSVDVIFTATDESGNSSQCAVSVEVVDVTAPVIECPANITVTTTNSSGTLVEVPQPVYSDACQVADVTNSFNNSDDATGNYSIGTTSVQFTATDASGNATSCTTEIEVLLISGLRNWRWILHYG